MAERDINEQDKLGDLNQDETAADFTADKKAVKPTPKEAEKPVRSVWTEVHNQSLDQLKEKSKERLSNLPGNTPESSAE